MTDTHTDRPASPRQRKQRSDGARSRNTILREAAQLATVEGIGGLSIGRLADAVGMSKSGLFAHFGSKEELQLATIETATAIYSERVIEPALEAPAGLERLKSLTEHFLVHVEENVFPGGCFFASVMAEMDTHPGPVRDSALRLTEEWFGQLATAVRDAQTEGKIDPAEDPEDLAFEIDAYLLLANAQFVARHESTPIDRARRALARRLAAAAPRASSRPPV
jgi:AcrR family transcriptional regulator